MDKNWDRPWSMQEIIDNSENWSLAGDVALLNSLKAFAENLIKRSTEINNNLLNLTNNLDEASLRLDITNNQFQSLRNSQFIESRVYEDDETLPPETNVKPELKEIDRTEEIRLAAVKGLQVIDKYFDKISVTDSDSEDDDNLPNYVLQAKELYDRPLPYVIGSEEWHKTQHGGLEDSSDESETEKVSDKFSESDSESYLQFNQSQIKGSSSSSELEFSKASSGSEANFAEQLSEKLEEVNRRPIIKTEDKFGDFFFDEPPPLDKGIFSGGRGLFDDDDDDEFMTPEASIEPQPNLRILHPSNAVKPPLIDEEPPSLDKKPVGGVSVFGNIVDKKLLRRQSSDETKESPKKVDLFSDSPPVLPKKTEKEVSEKKIDLFNDDDDLFKEDLFSSGAPKKFTSKLFDDDERGEGLFSQVDDANSINFGGKDPSRGLFESSPDDDLFSEVDRAITTREQPMKPEIDKKPIVTSTTNKQRSSLFDSPPPLFNDDDLFGEQKSPILDPTIHSQISENDRTNRVSNVLDSPPTSIKNIDDLFGEGDVTIHQKEKPKISRIFNSSPPPIDDDLFGNASILESKSSEPFQSETKASIFDPSPPPVDDDLFGNVEDLDAIQSSVESSVRETSEKRIKTNIFAPSPPPIDENLFGDDPKLETTDKDDELFADETFEEPKIEQTKKTSIFDTAPPPIDELFEAILDPTQKTNGDSKKSDLFDSSPPPLDDDLFADKKKTFLSIFDSSPPSLDDDLLGGADTKQKTPAVSLFDNTPPPDEVEEVVKSKVSDISQKFLKEEEVKPKPAVASPGKLKLNLNINVGALMPGYGPPKKAEVKKVVSFEEEETVEDDVEVLHSVTKDRARAPLQRRPSTRRGRKAALRTSSSDFKLETDDVKSEETKNQVTGEDHVNKSEKIIKPIKTKTDELSKSEGQVKKTVVKREDQKGAKNQETDEDHQNKSEEIRKPIKTKTDEELTKSEDQAKKTAVKREDQVKKSVPVAKSENIRKPIKTSSLFSDSEDEDDLFTSKNVIPKQAADTKKSLFEDSEDSDDDIFKGAASVDVKKPVKKEVKISALKKLQNTEPDVDPLSALLK